MEGIATLVEAGKVKPLVGSTRELRNFEKAFDRLREGYAKGEATKIGQEHQRTWVLWKSKASNQVNQNCQRQRVANGLNLIAYRGAAP